MVNLGIGLNIAGPLIMIVITIIGAVKAWPYRKVDRQKFASIYKPYKYIALAAWLIFDLAGIIIIMNA